MNIGLSVSPELKRNSAPGSHEDTHDDFWHSLLAAQLNILKANFSTAIYLIIIHTD